jgi:hypothetical protein
MMGAWAAALLLGPGEQKLTLTGPNGLKGTAALTQRIMPNGNKVTSLTMNLKPATGPSATVVTESTYAPTGRPVRKLQRTTSGGRAVTFTAVFGGQKVDYTLQATGAEPVKVGIDYPAGPIEAQSEFWFIRDPVRPGSQNTYWRLDLPTRSWVETKSVVKGPVSLKIGGKTVSAQLMETGEAKVWMTPQGRLLRLTTPQVTLEAAGS